MPRGRYKMIARLGPEVRRERFETLDEALAALEARVPTVSRSGHVSAITREYEPGRQVAGRLELHGPSGARGGLDVRGDGSAEAYRGWIRKERVEQQDGESAVDALRCALSG